MLPRVLCSAMYLQSHTGFIYLRIRFLQYVIHIHLFCFSKFLDRLFRRWRGSWVVRFISILSMIYNCVCLFLITLVTLHSVIHSGVHCHITILCQCTFKFTSTPSIALITLNTLKYADFYSSIQFSEALEAHEVMKLIFLWNFQYLS